MTDDTPAALMQLRVGVLFRLDGAGDLLSLNERGGALPPAVYVGLAEGETAVATFRADVPAVQRDAVHAALAACASPGGRAIVAALGAAFVGAQHSWCGPAFVVPPPLVNPVGAMQLFPGNAGLLHPELATLGPELPHRRPAFAVVRESRAVSVCYSARANGAGAEAGVETVPAYRGQGCAMLTVEAWAAAVRASGRTPFYSTSWENAASLAVARKLGLEQVGEDVWVA